MLNWLSTANVDAETDVITYTQWLNSHGKMEADLTVTKLGPQSSPNNPYGADQFIVVATDTVRPRRCVCGVGALLLVTRVLLERFVAFCRCIAM